MKHLWLILFVIIGCASNWQPVTLELKNGTVLKGEVRTMNRIQENILFVTLDSTGMRIKIEDIKKSFVGKEEVPIERIEYTYKLITPNKYVSPPSSPSDPNATREVLQHLLNIYQDYNQETQSPLYNSINKPKCQYDGYDLKKTFESKPYEPGDNLKKAYKWKCLSGHEYWIVE